MSTLSSSTSPGRRVRAPGAEPGLWGPSPHISRGDSGLTSSRGGEATLQTAEISKICSLFLNFMVKFRYFRVHIYLIYTSYPFIQIQSLKFVILIERKYCAQTKMRGMENEFLTLFQVQEQVSDAEVSLRLWHQRHLLLLQNGLIRQNIYKIFSDLTQCWNTNSLAELGD